MKTTKPSKSVWHYPGKGDFPPKDEPVIVHVVSLTNWVIRVTKKGTGAAVSESHGGRISGMAIDFHTC